MVLKRYIHTFFPGYVMLLVEGHLVALNHTVLHKIHRVLINFNFSHHYQVILHGFVKFKFYIILKKKHIQSILNKWLYIKKISMKNSYIYKYIKKKKLFKL